MSLPGLTPAPVAAVLRHAVGSYGAFARMASLAALAPLNALAGRLLPRRGAEQSPPSRRSAARRATALVPDFDLVAVDAGAAERERLALVGRLQHAAIVVGAHA